MPILINPAVAIPEKPTTANKINNNIHALFIIIVTPSFVGILIYDLWTNFGTFLGGWYTHTWEGLVLCYTNALPFMLWHLLSTTIAMTLVIVPIVYLKENKITLPEFQIKPLERKISIAAPVILMILALISLLV